MQKIFLEICANSLDSALEAQSGGADRIELCENLELGGVTPSAGTLKLCREKLHIPIHVLIRPRGGDFLYSDHEFEVMKQDVIFCKEIGMDGVVIVNLSLSLNADGYGRIITDKTKVEMLCRLIRNK